MILIIGHRPDPHVGSVVAYLERLGANYTVVDSFDANSDGIQILPCDELEIDIDGPRKKFDNISAVWWRQKPRFIVPSDNVTALYDYYFVHREWNHLLDYLGRTLTEVFNINDFSKAASANNKIIQLRAAKDAGFSVPRTLVSNNASSIAAFVSGGSKEFIFKTFTPYMTPSGHMTYTSIVDETTVRSKIESIKVSPGIFQEFIDKSVELRITIVGSEIFTASINSSYSNASRIDWRQDIFEDIYDRYKISDDFSQKLLKLHRNLGLFFGAYDFIIDDEDNPVFLEVNPMGQWMWLEMRLNFPISERIALALANAQRASHPSVSEAD